MRHIIYFQVSDLDWLQALIDLHDLHEYDKLIYNAKFRRHLLPEKRALGLQHLAFIN